MAEERQDSEDEDSFKYRSERKTSDSQETSDSYESSKQAQASPSTKKSPSRKIDLGAAASYSGSNAQGASNGDFADFTSAPVSSGQPSTMNELADILTTPLPQPNLLPMQSPNTISGGGANVDLFADFSSPGILLLLVE